MVIMKRSLLLGSLIVLVLVAVLGPYGTAAQGTQPLRIFIRSGPKSHGPGAHDYPRYLKEWVPLLNERGREGHRCGHVSDQGAARRN